MSVCAPCNAGLLRKQEGGRSAFAGVKKSLRLLVDDVNDMAPSDIAYTFSGYAPLGIRLIEVRFQGVAWFQDQFLCSKAQLDLLAFSLRWQHRRAGH